ncbi:glycosyltransferase like family 2-domain-containing protein [Boeremia exigua]|uniref:glycosyltransferase like family 2-domain-containing protein n=1 Tax=Boeremia exigua TaxID=749465 RepID=UPI001E8DFE52|nr:glycosyltransferase like family 2-domain-containing protein [Boeremia exigua]KAH6633771.1 glycosyltransferase like family 2-domain-containing protein [Boeremia exigua]
MAKPDTRNPGLIPTADLEVREVEDFGAKFVKCSEEHASHYKIVTVDGYEKDLFTLTNREKRFLRFIPITTLLPILLNIYYWWIQYRLLLASSGSFSNTAFVARRGYVVLEMITNVPEYCKKLLDASVIAKGSWRSRLWLYGLDVPSVDIAIVCCNEDLTVILDTVRAALNTDWPSDRMRIIVSDDGAQKNVQQGVQHLQEQYPGTHLFYTARQKTPSNSHKAGNLNHVLNFTAKLPGGQAPFLAGLDVDMIPERKWLRVQLPHLLLDPGMAFTCPPPCFYNVPTNDPLSQSLFVFNRYEEILKDAAGIACCTGSGWVMRLTAIAEIGGFPSQSLTEDLLCSHLLLGKGWRSAYVQEELQWGLVPETYHAHIRQRTRWSTGGVQAGLIMRLCLFGERARHLNSWQRAYGFWYLYQNITATLRVLEVVKTAVMLIAGWPIVVYTHEEQLMSLLKISSAAHAINFVRQCLMATVNGYAASCGEAMSLYFLNTYFAIDHWKTFIIPKSLGGRSSAFSAKFPSTGSLSDELYERHRPFRAPLRARLKSILITDGGIIPVAIAFSLAIGVLMNFRAAIESYGYDIRACFFYLLPRVLWASSMWPTYAVAFSRPLYYAIFPPDMPERENLLKGDAAGVARPKDHSKLPKSPIRGLGIELVNSGFKQSNLVVHYDTTADFLVDDVN